MSRWLKYTIIVAVSIAVGAAVAVLTEFSSLIHYSDKISYTNDNGIKTTLITGSGSVSFILSDEAAAGKGRYVRRFLVKLNPGVERPLSLTADVYTAESGGKPFLTIRDCNPLYVKTQVFDVDCENVVSISVSAEDAAFSVADVRVQNSFVWNPYIFLSAALSVLALLLVIFGKREAEVKYRIRWAFVIISLSFGTLLVCVLPEGKVGYDEETHLQAVLSLASFPANELHISQDVMNQVTVTEYNNPSAYPKGPLEKKEYSNRLSAAADYKEGARNPDFYVMKNRVPAYLPMAAAVKICKGLSLPWKVLIFSARFSNLLMYVLLVTAALSVLPEGQVLMAFLALFPQNLFLASTVSYDPFVTGFLFLGTAFFLRLLLTEEENEKKTAVQAVLMILCMFLACLPKAVYAPMLLTTVLIPLRRIRDRKKSLRFIAAVCAAFILTVLLFIIPTLLHPSDTGDVRGGETVSEAGQIGFILGHPFTYAGILLSQMVRWIPQTLFGPNCMTYMGHLVNENINYPLLTLPYEILLFLILAAGILSGDSGKEEEHGLRIVERLWILFMCFGTSVLIWTAMYVTFTEPGAKEITGVQGRYFAPVLFSFYHALGASLPGTGNLAVKIPGKAGNLVRNRQMWYDTFLGIITVLTGLAVWISAVVPYCL